MNYCSNKSKAIVTFEFKNGTKETILSKNPALSIQMTPTGSGIKKVYLRGFAYANGSQCTPVPNHEEYRGEIPANVTPTLSTRSGGTCDNGSSVGYVINEIGGNTGTEWKAGSVSIREEYLSQNGCEILVTDESGIIYKKSISNEACPNYKVSCDDECPQGQERIPTIEYPGYKCREKCPPETCCECNCGDVICCYGSNGQILKTIKK